MALGSPQYLRAWVVLGSGYGIFLIHIYVLKAELVGDTHEDGSLLAGILVFY